MNRDVLTNDFRLPDIARDAVKNEEIDIRLVDVEFAPVIDLRSPKLDRQLVWNQLPTTGVVNKFLSKRSASIQGSEDVAAGAMEEPRDGAKHFSLSSLPRSGCTENEEGGTLGVGRIRHFGKGAVLMAST